MERKAIIIFLCVLLSSAGRVFRTQVEIMVKAGDSVALYCDRAITFGSNILWMRNSSDPHQPFLVIDPLVIFSEKFPRLSFFTNSSSNSHDLHIENVSISDEGIYYCSKREHELTDSDGIIITKHVFEPGIWTHRLTVLVSQNESTITSTPPPVLECDSCWKLLLSVCTACVLLSSLPSFISGYFFGQAHREGSDMSADMLKAYLFKAVSLGNHQCEESETGKLCVHTEVSYRLLTNP